MMAIEIRGLAPLLQVFDMPRSLAFYRDVLGFEIVSASASGDNADWVMLRLAGVEIMLNTAYETDQRPDEPDPARIAAHADTGLFFGCADVDGAYRYLRARGIDAAEPQLPDYGMKQLYLTDPDGYTLCFQWPAS